MKAIQKIGYNATISLIVALTLMWIFVVFSQLKTTTNVFKFATVSIYSIKCLFQMSTLYLGALKVPEWSHLKANKKSIWLTAFMALTWLDVFKWLLTMSWHKSRENN